MKKLFFPFIAASLLLLGAGSALVGCKSPTTGFSQAALDHQNKYKVVDDSIIQSYLARHNYGPGTYTRTNSGLYLITLPGSNPQGNAATAGKQVSVRYEGRFVQQAREDIIFDSSYNGRTLCNCYPFIVDDPNPNTRAVPGFYEGLKLMSQGEHKVLLIPSYLAYGAGGSGIIGPDTPLLFDVDVLAVSN